MSRVILLIEDDADVREAIREELTDAGYEVVEASSAATALAQLRGGLRPAAMLVDFVMPGLTGSEFLRTCRADPDLAYIPAVIMSAAAPDTLSAGGVDSSFLRKPFQPDELRTVVARLLAAR